MAGRKEKLYNLSIRCYYEGGERYTTHRQLLRLTEISKWVEAYIFTHPNVEGFSIRVFVNEGVSEDNNDNISSHPP